MDNSGRGWKYNLGHVDQSVGVVVQFPLVHLHFPQTTTNACQNQHNNCRSISSFQLNLAKRNCITLY